jgi:hypothetical protein
VSTEGKVEDNTSQLSPTGRHGTATAELPEPSQTPDPEVGNAGGRGRVQDLVERVRRQPDVVLLTAAAALPVLMMAWRVHQSPLLQYADYWDRLLKITNPDGSLHWRGLLTYQNEHPFIVPNVIYYVGARFFGGSNHVLGYYSILIAIAAVIVLRAMLPARWSPLARAALTVALSAVIFCPSGIWNYSRGMSGTAWLSANFFAVLAVLFAWHRRTILAVAAACIAIACYGTGFGAPVAVIAVALLRRDARWRWMLPLAALGCAGIVYELTSSGGSSGGSVSHDPSLLASTFLSYLGMLWDPSAGTLSIAAGAAGLLLLVLGYVASRRDEELHADLIPWWGVAVFTITAGALISLKRSETFEGSGVQSRYASLSALYWIAVGVVALRVMLVQRPIQLRIAVPVTVLLIFYAVSPSLVTRDLSEDQAQDLAATALRINAAGSFNARVHSPAQQIPRLKALGDYPFNSQYSLGCGGLVPGDSIDPTKVRTLTLTRPNWGAIDSAGTVGDSTQYNGWLRRGSKKAECVLVIDSKGTIRGGGVAGVSRPDVVQANPSFPGDLGFQAVAPAGISDLELVLGYDDGFWTFPASTPAR